MTVKETVREDTPEFREGKEAWRRGATEGECPYPIGDNRRASWFGGYFTARTRAKVLPVLRRYGEDWP